MDRKLFSDITFELTEREKQRLYITCEDDEDRQILDGMFSGAAAVANPKAVLQMAVVEDRLEDGVVINGVTILSPLVRKNLANSNRVFMYVASCGTELAAWAKGYDDMLQEYFADEIMKMYLGHILSHLRDYVKDSFMKHGNLSAMNPGSLKEWPITAQFDLFAAIGGVKDAVGVTLTDSALMVPSKSVSGMFFESEAKYENCMYCPLNKCPNRRAAYVSEF